MKQATPSPSDGWHACSRRSQLALDLTVRGTGYTYTPLHSPGDCIEVGVFAFLVLWLLLSRKMISNEFATLHFVYADRRATARTTTFVEPCSIQKKKACILTNDSTAFICPGCMRCFCKMQKQFHSVSLTVVFWVSSSVVFVWVVFMFGVCFGFERWSMHHRHADEDRVSRL